MTHIPSIDDVTAQRLKALKLAHADLRRRPDDKGLENAFMTLLRDTAEALISFYRPQFLKAGTETRLDRRAIFLRLEMIGLDGDVATAVFATIVEKMVAQGCHIISGSE